MGIFIFITVEKTSISYKKLHFKTDARQVQWLTPIIPALWEARAGRLPGQEIETVLANTVKLRLYQKYKK